MFRRIVNGEEVWEEGAVHGAFGLTYAAYFCVPRIVLQAMPPEWQEQFVALMEQLPETPTYDVRRRDERGRWVRDPLRDYRHSILPDDIAAHIAGLIEPDGDPHQQTNEGSVLFNDRPFQGGDKQGAVHEGDETSNHGRAK